jgi:putative flippase GtrA
MSGSTTAGPPGHRPFRADATVIDAALLRYLLVGVLNTLLGFGLVLLLQEGMGLPPFSANVAGYAAGLVCSYFLNRHFTFKSRRRHRDALPSFAAAAALSYGVNFGVLAASLNLLHLPPVLAQTLAAVSFTGCFYVLSRLFVFRAREDASGMG